MGIMATTELLGQARSDFERGIWGEAYARFSAADRQAPLAAEDLERLAVAAQLVGKDDVSAAMWERAHLQLLQRGDVAWAVRCAFWLALGLVNRGEMARGAGWLGRAQRLVQDHELDCAERGFLLVPAALGTLEGGDPSLAHSIFGEVIEVGQRFGEPDLVALGRLGQGRALVRMGRAAEGVA